MIEQIPDDWQEVLAAEFDKPYFTELRAFVERERESHTVFPPERDVFRALHLAPFDSVRVMVLGQDPYHDEGQAHGLCFSVRPGVPIPPSLRNIFKELHSDVGVPPPATGYLEKWARQGMLMINAVLTVRAHEANSHKGRGWEEFTDAVIQAVNHRNSPVIFVLWGNYARKKAKLIDTSRHRVIESAHPSPLSARRGFFGSRPFSRINAILRETGRKEIDWRLPAAAPVQGELPLFE